MHQTPRLQLDVPDPNDNVSVYPADSAESLGVLDAAALDHQDVLASRPAPGLAGTYFWATDAKQLFRDNGAAWVLLYPSVKDRGRAFTCPDTLSPDSFAGVIGSFFIKASASETLTLVGAYIHVCSVGSSPSVFALHSDRGAHGTLSPIAGLSGLTPTTTQQLVLATGGPITMSAGDRVALKAPTPGNSLGYSIDVIIESTG